MPQLDPQFFASQIFWTLLSFGILYFYFIIHGKHKITSMLDERENRIKTKTELSSQLQSEVEKTLAEINEKIEEAKENAQSSLISSKRDTDIMISRKKDEFSELIKKRIEATDLRIKNKIQEAAPKINDAAKEIGLGILKKVGIDSIKKESIEKKLDKIA